MQQPEPPPTGEHNNNKSIENAWLVFGLVTSVIMKQIKTIHTIDSKLSAVGFVVAINVN
jgi:hypothetical protein